MADKKKRTYFPKPKKTQPADESSVAGDIPRASDVGGQNDPSGLDRSAYNAGQIFLQALAHLMELSSRTENADHSELLQQIQSTVFRNIASTIAGLQTEQQNYMYTIDFVRGIIELSPNPVEFFVNLFKDVSLYETEYHEMVTSMYDTELKELLQNSNAESILLLMKNLGNGQENFKLKGTKTDEEKKNDVEVQDEKKNETTETIKIDEEQNKEIETQSEEQKKEIEKGTKMLEEQVKKYEIQAERAIESKKEIKIEIQKATKMLEEQKKENEIEAKKAIEMTEQKKKIEIDIQEVTKMSEEQKKEKETEAKRAIKMTEQKKKIETDIQNTTKMLEEKKKENETEAKRAIEMTKKKKKIENDIEKATKMLEEQKKENETEAKRAIEMTEEKKKIEIDIQETTKMLEEIKKENETEAERVIEITKQKKRIQIEIQKATKMLKERKKENEIEAKREVKITEQKKRIEIEIEKATKMLEETKKEIEIHDKKLIEIKKESQTIEEQKKEIKGQAQNEIEMKNATKTEEEQKKKNKVGMKKANKTAEVQKKQNNEAINKKKDLVTSLWNSMSIKAKKDILKIKISDLSTHSSSELNPIISEALSWYDTKKSWEFWHCCECGKKFVPVEDFRLHLATKHSGSLNPIMQSITPMGVDNIWSELVLKCPWEPLDASTTAKILADKKERKDSELVEDTPPQKNSECDQVFKDAWDSSLQKHGFENSLNQCDIFEKVTSSGFNESEDSVLSYVVSKDPKLKELLEKIQAVFELLISHQYLGANHLNSIIKFTIEELQGLPIKSHILSEGLDQTPLCICFLGQTPLTKILKFLQEISQSCGIGIYSDKKKDEQVIERDYMFIYADASIILSDYFLKPVDVFLEWIYSGVQQLTTSSPMNDEQLVKETEIFETLQQEYCHMDSFYERKCDYMNYEEAVKSVQDLCLEENKKWKACTEYIPKSYESVLRKRREELIEAENVMMFIGSRFELDAITNVLKEVEAQPNDNVDTFITDAIQEQQKQLSVEISKIDARILRSFSVIQQLKLELETVSAHDYESKLFTLAKLYLRKYLEDLADKDASEKSEAAYQALLAESELEKKKGGSEKPKGKKKGKQSKKAKGSKVVSSPQQHVLTVDGEPFQVSPDGDAAEVDNAVQKEELSSKREQLEAEGTQTEKGIKLLDELQKNSEVVSNVEHLEPFVDQLADEDLDFNMVRNFVAKVNDWPEKHLKLPLTTSSSTPLINYGEGVSDLPSDKVNVENLQRADRFGIILRNDAGENNCFLNVIIQSLWHLRQFREEIVRSPIVKHTHAGNLCVVCALHETFASMSLQSSDSKSEAVDPTVLRKAISNLCCDSNLFREGQMNDASEVLRFILKSLHGSLSSSDSNVESIESNCRGSWECASNPCLVHHFFGMNIFERMECSCCGLESKCMKYTSFVHDINASALRTRKASYTESSFDELLNIEMKRQETCDPDVGGCRTINNISYTLTAPPPCVFTAVLGWQNISESADHIAETLAALSTEIDISVLYPNLDPKNTHNLVSVVCYGGLHYILFVNHHEEKCWVMFNNTMVKVIGGWTDVLTLCKEECFQPQVLFFEASTNPKPSH